jgi:micrococcal nuclease
MLAGKRQSPFPDTVILAPIWRRHPWVALVVVGIVALALLTRPAVPTGGDFDKYHEREFTVVHVADGDTFDIDIPDGKYDQTRIRLWGVDTPEVAGSRDGAMHYGDEASRFAKTTLLGQRVRVQLNPARTRDKYDRLLAYVTLVADDASYGEALLARGFAYADWRFDHPLKNSYKRLERKARREDRGLWAEVTPADMPAWRRRMERELNYNPP